MIVARHQLRLQRLQALTDEPDIFELAPSTFTRLGQWFRQPQVLAVWAATATLALGITILAAITFSTREPESPAVNDPEFSLEDVDPYNAPKYIATVISTTNCTFKQDSLQLKPGMRLTSGRVKLQRGSLVIKYDSGVRATLKGPADLIVQSDNSSQLKLGGLVANGTKSCDRFCY